MRPPTACLTCRNRRRKCIASAPGEACVYCKKRNKPCTLTLHPSFTKNDVTSDPSPSDRQSIPLNANLPPRSVCEDLIRTFFFYLHDTTQWIFHKPSILEDFQLRRLPECLLLSMIAMSARFSNHSFFASIDPRARGLPYAQKAASMLDLRNVSVMSIQLCLLLGAYFSNDGEAVSENIYYSTACRMATLLRLDQLVSSTLLEQELVVRLLWTVNMSDVWSSNGNRVARMLPPLPARFPIEDSAFDKLQRPSLDSIDSQLPLPPTVTPEFSPASILGNIIQLNGILAQIADAINTMSGINEPGNGIALHLVDSLAAQLDSWYENLDARLKDTEENLQYHALEGTAHMFVSLYLGYYHYGQLLYYVYLQEQTSTGLPSVSHPYAARCKSYAVGLCDLLYRACETPGAEVYYSMVGHVLVVASTVQIHTVLFDTDAAEISTAKKRLERNYQILTELLCFWPTLDVAMGRLREFHKACLRSKEGSFRMDQWMLKFLFEFGKPVEEKPTSIIDTMPEWPIISPALTDFALSDGLQEDFLSSPSTSDVMFG